MTVNEKEYLKNTAGWTMRHCGDLAELWRVGEEELNLRGEQGWLS